MDNIKKQAFTRRLSQCNKGEMVVIMYEICFAYMDDVKKAYKEDRHGDFLESLRKVTRTIDELVNALDHQYDLSHQLYRLYQFCKREIARCTYENQVEGLLEAEKILTRLYKSFVEVAKKDESGPIMSNTQPVYAGITYGKYSLTENCMELDSQRGFFV